MIYKHLWGKLPGNLIVKVLTASALFLTAIALLFLFVFPWVEVSFFAPPTVGA